MNKKGFFLAETIAVIAVVAVVLITVFKVFSAVYLSYRQSEKYNTVAAVNALANMQKYYESLGSIDTTSLDSTTSYIELTNYEGYASEYYTKIKEEYNVTNVYLVDLDGVEDHLSEFYLNMRRYLQTILNREGIVLIAVVNNDEFAYSKINRNDNKKCTYNGELVQGAEYVDGQYTYRYKQQYDFTDWVDITNDGWGVRLTDRNATAPITTMLCSTINDKPIVSLSNLFRESKATTIYLNGFNTSNVTSMHSMFFNSDATDIIGLQNLNTSNVTIMQSMFAKTKLHSLDLSNFNTSNVTNMDYMFFDSRVSNINVSSFNTSNVTSMNEMFYNADIKVLDLSSFDMTNVTNTANMFTLAKANVGYAKTQADADRLNGTTAKPSTLVFRVPDQPLQNNTLVTNFYYTGNYQSFTVPTTGYYKVELWGAQGGSYDATYIGGLGAKTTGYINLTQGDTIYVYVGGAGGVTTDSSTTVAGGWNGGGAAKTESASESAATSGGGATDIRLVSGTWDNATSLNSRIMVAAGGGGSDYSSVRYGYGGDGGGLLGESGASSDTDKYGLGGNPKSAGLNNYDSTTYTELNGVFGGGGNTISSGSNSGSGGSGYYGGATGYGYRAGGGGGSSFISGYAGVNAITSASNRTHTDNTKHYSGKYFINGSMIAGNNTGNGKAKISYVGTTMPRTNTNLNNVRYIKDCATGSTINTYKNWVEIQAIRDGTNIAYGKSIYLLSGATLNNIAKATDGIIYPNDGASNAYINDASGEQCAILDLGATYDLDEIAIWHNYIDGRTFYNNITSVSSDNNTWITVINKSEAETSQGKRVNAWN